ncbi:hypothetical protein AB0G79_24725 [Streptomyces sp. NPDC020807]|uniref:hypothetical protein n=1 Tax=Streptomyces sp. NPDC020807 TaxID=3155119 RepID=UPI003404F12D
MTTLHTAPSGYGRHRQAEPHPAAPHTDAPHGAAPHAAALHGAAPHGAALRAEESVPQIVPPAPVPVPVLPDPPIYQDLVALWASQGRTLPGHRDQEWNRLAAGPVWADRTVRVSGTLVRPGDAR